MLQTIRIIFLILLFPPVATAKVYNWIDTQGKVHYSDQARNGAKLIQVNPGYEFRIVRKVYDGDTVLLDNGIRVRLLGINAPEVAHRDKPAEVGGDAAKNWLQNRILGKKVRLEKDITKKDKYGRVLAHLFTEDGLHINLALLENGLAAINIYPPNLKYSDDMLVAQQQAELHKMGIWGEPRYAVKAVTDIPGHDHKGWQRLSGRVKGLRETRQSEYLLFNSDFNVRIKKQQLPLFPDIQGYVGKVVEIRGWVKKYKNQFTMLLRHPSAIIVLNLNP